MPVVHVSFMNEIFRQSTIKHKATTRHHLSNSVSTQLFTKPTDYKKEPQKGNNASSIKPLAPTKLVVNLNSIVKNENLLKTTLQSHLLNEDNENISERSSMPATRDPNFNADLATNSRLTDKSTSTHTPESEYSPTRVSLFTLTALLGVIYGLAFLLAVVWVGWLYVKRKSRQSLKRSQIDSRDFCSINSVS